MSRISKDQIAWLSEPGALEVLDAVTDAVLAYRPKPKTKAAKKRARRKKRKKKRD